MIFGTCLSNSEVQIVKGKIFASSSMMRKNPEISRVTHFFSATVHADTSAYHSRTLGSTNLDTLFSNPIVTFHLPMMTCSLARILWHGKRDLTKFVFYLPRITCSLATFLQQEKSDLQKYELLIVTLKSISLMHFGTCPLCQWNCDCQGQNLCIFKHGEQNSSDPESYLFFMCKSSHGQLQIWIPDNSKYEFGQLVFQPT